MAHIAKLHFKHGADGKVVVAKPGEKLGKEHLAVIGKSLKGLIDSGVIELVGESEAKASDPAQSPKAPADPEKAKA